MFLKNKTPEELETQFAYIRKKCPDILDLIDRDAVQNPISFLRKKYHAEYSVYLSLLRYLKGKKAQTNLPEELESVCDKPTRIESLYESKANWTVGSQVASKLGIQYVKLVDFVERSFSPEEKTTAIRIRKDTCPPSYDYHHSLEQKILALYVANNPQCFYDINLKAIAAEKEIDYEELMACEHVKMVISTARFVLDAGSHGIRIIAPVAQVKTNPAHALYKLPIIGRQWLSRNQLLGIAQEVLDVIDHECVLDALIFTFNQSFLQKAWYKVNGKKDLYVSPSFAAKIETEIRELVEFTNNFSGIYRSADFSDFAHNFVKENPDKMKILHSGNKSEKTFQLYHKSIMEHFRNRIITRDEAAKEFKKLDSSEPLYISVPKFLLSLGIQGDKLMFSALAQLLDFEINASSDFFQDKILCAKIQKWLLEVKLWESASALTKRLSISPQQINIILKYYQEENKISVVYTKPEDLNNTFIAPYLIVRINEETSPPTGWLPNSILLTHFQNDPRIQKTLLSLKAQSPNDFREYWQRQIDSFTRQDFVSPSAVEHILKTLNPFLQEPVQSLGDLATQFNRDPKILSPILEDIASQSRSLVFTRYIDGRLIDYYGSGIISQLKNKLPPPNDQWMTAEQMAKELDTTREIIIRRTRELSVLPTDFYNTKSGKKEPFYDPNIVEKISEI